MLIFFSPLSVRAKEAWEDQGLEWYYDNLTAEDHLKIRQAMDYAIPRQQICEGLCQGYAIPIATEIASNVIGHNPSIYFREYNLSKSKELLAEVFGKYYENSSVAEANETVTNTPYFKITLSVPHTGITRTLWADLIAQAFQNIGIEAVRKSMNMNIFIPRIFLDPPGVGLNYDHGGYDAVFTIPTLTPDPDLANRYYPTNFVPVGENYQWIENEEVTEIIKHSLTDSSFINRLQALKSFQAWSYEWVPQSQIRQDFDIFLINPNVMGFDSYNYGREPWVHNLSLIEGNPHYNFTSCVYTDFTSFNPLLSTGWIDSISTSNIHLSLAGRRGAYNLTHPIGHVAKNWTSTPDGLELTVSIRKGLKFHDGSEVTAADVVFSYKAAMECPDSEWKEEMFTWFNNSEDISKVDNYTVKFHLKKFDPYVTSQVFSLPILSKAQMEPIGYTNWKTDGTNIGFTPLIGCGPYEFSEYNYPNVSYKKAFTWNVTLMGHNPTANGGGIWLNSTSGPDFYKILVIKDETLAISQLENESADLLDLCDFSGRQWFYGNTVHYVEELEDVDWIKIVIYPSYYCWELGFNHYDPRWGLNPHDPREMYPEESQNNRLIISNILNRLLFGGLFIIIVILLVFLLNRNK